MAPALFDTVQVYSPLLSAVTDSMSNALLRLLYDIDMYGFSCVSIGSPLKNQLKSKGLSPMDTEQVADMDSPELTALSANENGTICGAAD